MKNRLILLCFLFLIVFGFKSMGQGSNVNKQFLNYSYNEGLSDKDIFDIIEYNDRIWVHTSQKVFQFSDAQFQAVSIKENPDSLSGVWRPQFFAVYQYLFIVNRSGFFLFVVRMNSMEPVACFTSGVNQICSL